MAGLLGGIFGRQPSVTFSDSLCQGKNMQGGGKCLQAMEKAEKIYFFIGKSYEQTGAGYLLISFSYEQTGGDYFGHFQHPVAVLVQGVVRELDGRLFGVNDQRVFAFIFEQWIVAVKRPMPAGDCLFLLL
jgi:hypothetical protein